MKKIICILATLCSASLCAGTKPASDSILCVHDSSDRAYVVGFDKKEDKHVLNSMSWWECTPESPCPTHSLGNFYQVNSEKEFPVGTYIASLDNAAHVMTLKTTQKPRCLKATIFVTGKVPAYLEAVCDGVSYTRAECLN